MTRRTLALLCAVAASGCVRTEPQPPWRDKLNRGEVVRLGGESAPKSSLDEGVKAPKSTEEPIKLPKAVPSKAATEPPVELPEPPPPIPPAKVKAAAPKTPSDKAANWKPLDWNDAKNSANPPALKLK